MSFYLFFLCGVAGGLLGGMGMGGGTALIPLLTIFLGVRQRTAQGINLISFLPMSAAALFVHAKSGLLETREILPLAIPALLLGALSSLVAGFLPQTVLKTSFGLFLVILSLFRLKNALFSRRVRKTE